MCLQRQHKTCIVVGETGSGKSTQLPQYLAEERGSRALSVVCTQPRRVAAITIASRVAAERGCSVGEEVGYAVRFEDKSSAVTRIKYVTDGLLLRETISDPLLSKYDVVILDESHERSLQTDILMGLLKGIQVKRPTFRLVIMSATLEVDLFMNFFDDTHAIHIPGRQFPVQIYYTKQPEEDFIDAAFLTCLQIHAEEEAGGILVFLPGQEDIENLTYLLEEHLPFIQSKHSSSRHQRENARLMQDFCIFPLYAAMPQEEQLLAFQTPAPGVRKIVVATNIAETSLTISGVRYVVDSGFHKSRAVSSSGMETLRVTPVSQSQANQRAGRAGRESSGKCFRLYCESAFERLEQASIPEIKRMNIAQVVLELKAMGIDASAFPFPSPPPPASISRAVNTLHALGAIDKSKV